MKGNRRWPEATGNPDDTVTSKVLAIMEVFETSRRALSLTEISEAAGLPLSTTHRLVNELVEWGMLSRGPNGGIQLGLRLWAIAQNAGRQLRETARPFIQDLFALTGETSQLAVRDGNMALFIDRVYGPRRVPRASRVGGRLPLHATAVGKVLPGLFGTLGVRCLPAAPAGRPDWPHPRPRSQVARGIGTGPRAGLRGDSGGGADRVVFDRGSGLPHGPLGVCDRHRGCRAHAATMPRHLPVLRGVSRRIEAATTHIPLETLLGTAIGPDLNLPTT